MESYTLYQLNEYIRRVVALNFREPVWIEAEIMQCRVSKGHCYIELIQKDETTDAVLAQSAAVIWYKNLQFIKRKVGDVLDDLLQDGTAVRVKCRVDFSERYGLKLLIEDVDPRFTYGQLELNRQKIIQRLEEEGLVELNRGLTMPTIVQRLAVISSANAAGYQDFVKQLEQNVYGYTYSLELYNCAVQGMNVERDTTAAISEILSKRKNYNAVIILRGGGSKLDLSAYDNYAIAKNIAQSDIPFIIGIGHDIDNTVADLVSCVSVKTPTAVADYLVERSLHFESKVEHSYTLIQQLSNNVINHANIAVSGYANRVELLAEQRLQLASDQLRYLSEQLDQSISHRLSHEMRRLEHLTETLEHLDPHNVLTRGYAYVTNDSGLVQKASDVRSGDTIDIHFQKEKIKATVE